MSTATAPNVINKLPRTATNEFRSALRTYLAEATEVEDNDEPTTEERARELVRRFRSEYGWAIKRDGVRKAAKDWLQGLAINVEYWNNKIPAVVLKLHGIEGGTMSPRLEDVCVENWWDVLADGVVRLNQEAHDKAWSL